MVSNRTFILMFLLSLLVLPGAAWSESPVSLDRGQPLEITSNRLESDGGLKQVVFLGNVVAKQGGLTIKASKLIVSYQGKNNQVSRIEAIGDVTIVKDNRIATGGRGVYEVGKETIVMTGSPRVQQGENSVEGDEIAFFLNEDRSIVKSKAGSRVKAILAPREKTVGP
jgi:lipopolysaccharide export system protein LptA